MTEQNRPTPREMLEQKLAKERKNSPVMKALLDRVELELAHENPREADIYSIMDRMS